MLNTIGKYKLEKELNHGTYGTCFSAIDEKNNKYAIKRIKKEGNQNDDIINEIDIMERMKSKYSVEFIEYIEKDDYFYIVMELCDGDLNYLIKKMKELKKKIDIIIIIKIILQLNEVIKLMHDKKIEHRDLKPENILVKFKDENEFEIKLTDYGFSKLYQSNSKYSQIYGTMYYSAPEVNEGNGNSKSDLWSIGIILYYLYFNIIPFKNPKEYFSSNNVLLKKSNFELFDELLSKLIKKDPKERINWDEYFIHPFNNLQIIEIYIDTEKNNTNTQILNKDYFKYDQLKDSIIYIDDNKNKFNTNFKLNKGKHKIIIYFNNIINNSSSMFNGCKDIIEIKFINFKTYKITNMSEMFANCSNLYKLDVSDFNTENVKDMKLMFGGCSKLNNLNVKNFKTNNVTDMSLMFANCSNLNNLNVSNFNTENVINMKGMFQKCSKLNNLNIKNFKTNKVTDMSGMFNNCSNLNNLDISSFNTQKVKDMKAMFQECIKLNKLDVKNFETNEVNDMSGMFNNCSNLIDLDLSNFNTENVINMKGMFNECSKLNKLDISNFKTNKVKDMSYMFNKCSNLNNLVVNNLNTENVINKKEMFNECYKLNKLFIQNFTTNKVINKQTKEKNEPINNNIIKNINIKENENDYYKNFKFENMNNIKTLNNNKGSINCLKILNDGRLAVGDSNSDLIIYNKETFKPEIIIQNNLSTLYNFTQLKNNYIACSFFNNNNHTLKIIKNINNNNESENQVIKNAHNRSITKIIELKNNNIITFSYDYSFKIWKLNNKNNKYGIIYQFKDTNQLSDGLEIKDNEIILYAVETNPKSLVFYNLYKNEKIKTLNDLDLCIYCIGYRIIKINNAQIVIAGDGIVYLIDANNYLILNAINSDCCNYCILKLSYNLFLIGDDNGTITQYKINNNTIIKESYKLKSHEDWILSMTLLNDKIISGNGYSNEIKIWK